MPDAISGEIKIQKVNDKWDLDFNSDIGDFDQDSGLETAILMSLLLDKRATEDQVPQPTKRCGYWGIDITQMEFSHLWLVNGRKTTDKLTIGIEYCNTALQWLVDHGYATEVNTSAEFITEGIKLSIEITKPNGIVDTFTAYLWLNTDF
jgi:phage gp46-like protein